MKGKQITVGALPIRLGEDAHEVVFAIKDPGVVRAAAFVLEKRLVMTRGDAQFDEVLTLFVEFNADGPMRNRRFLVLATNRQCGVPDGHALVFVGSAVSGNTGQVAHVYEVKQVS